MADYIFDIPVGTTGNTYEANIFKEFQNYVGIVSEAEEYKDNPVFFFGFGASGQYNLNARCWGTEVTPRGYDAYDNRVAISIERITSVNYVRVFNQPNAAYDSGAYFSGKEGGNTQTPVFVPTNPFSNVTQLPVGGYGSWASYQYNTILEWILCTNIPIFETNTEAFDYLNGASNLHLAVNYGDPVEKEGEEFTINNVWTHGTWSANGLTGMQGQNFRLVKGKILTGGRIAFYPMQVIQDGALKYGINFGNAEFDGIQYSIDSVNWLDSDTFPFDFFYREREDEIGEFDFGLSFWSYIPVFNDAETAQKWIDEDPSVSLEDAKNWPQISGQYPANNTTGSDLGQSIFSEVKVKGHFSQQYICDDGCLTALAADLFDTSASGMWEDFKKGLDAFGSSPIDAVMGLSWFPFDVGSIFNAPSSSYIWFGGYGWPVSGGSCKRITYANGYKSIGQLLINPGYHSWRDYEPYTKLYVQIPYCGTYQLDLARYWNKVVEVRYYIDTRTNGCIACLIADGYLTDYFNGQMGVTMPITLTDYSAYMNTQMQVLLQGGGQAAQSYGHAANAAASALPMGLGAGLLAGGATAGISGAITGAKTVYGLMQNNINNFNKTKGGSSSMLNAYLPQTVDFIFEIQSSIYDYKDSNGINRVSQEYQEYGQSFGFPSMKSGTLSNFSGFLKCQSVRLQCPIATERERERLKQMLLSGIYI